MSHSWDQTLQLCMGSFIFIIAPRMPKISGILGICVPGLAPKMKVLEMSDESGFSREFRRGFWKDLLLVGFCEKMMLYVNNHQKAYNECMF